MDPNFLARALLGASEVIESRMMRKHMKPSMYELHFLMFRKKFQVGDFAEKWGDIPPQTADLHRKHCNELRLISGNRIY